jgi:uncharacterized protein YdbL (DUF1318 family)
MNNKIQHILAISLLFWGGTAYGAWLDSARYDGLVCEGHDGTLKATVTTPQVISQVNKINSQRLNHYQKIAKSNGVTPSVVGAQMSKKLHAKHPDLVCKK